MPPRRAATKSATKKAQRGQREIRGLRKMAKDAAPDLGLPTRQTRSATRAAFGLPDPVFVDPFAETTRWLAEKMEARTAKAKAYRLARLEKMNRKRKFIIVSDESSDDEEAKKDDDKKAAGGGTSSSTTGGVSGAAAPVPPPPAAAAAAAAGAAGIAVGAGGAPPAAVAAAAPPADIEEQQRALLDEVAGLRDSNLADPALEFPGIADTYVALERLARARPGPDAAELEGDCVVGATVEVRGLRAAELMRLKAMPGQASAPHWAPDDECNTSYRALMFYRTNEEAAKVVKEGLRGLDEASGAKCGWPSMAATRAVKQEFAGAAASNKLRLEQIHPHASNLGMITLIRALGGKYNQISRVSAELTFESAAAALFAQRALNGYTFAGCPMVARST